MVALDLLCNQIPFGLHPEHALRSWCHLLRLHLCSELPVQIFNKQDLITVGPIFYLAGLGAGELFALSIYSRICLQVQVPIKSLLLATSH